MLIYGTTDRLLAAKGDGEVRCPECTAEVPAFREFCPQCGAATSRSRPGPDRPSERSDEELKRNRKTVLIIGAVLLVTAGIAGNGPWFSNIHFDRDDRPRGPVTIEAAQLYDAYRDDAQAASKRFEGREMVVSGEFVRIVPDGNGNPDLRLKTSNPELPLGADLAQIAHAEAAQLKPGQTVTVSCQRITGSEDERWLQNCAIQAVKVVSPPAAPSAPPAGGEGGGGG